MAVWCTLQKILTALASMKNVKHRSGWVRQRCTLPPPPYFSSKNAKMIHNLMSHCMTNTQCHSVDVQSPSLPPQKIKGLSQCLGNLQGESGPDVSSAHPFSSQKASMMHNFWWVTVHVYSPISVEESNSSLKLEVLQYRRTLASEW